MSSKIRIVWPIDPTQRLESADKNLHSFLHLLRGCIDFELQPVCVLSADFFTTSHYFEPVDIDGLKVKMTSQANRYIDDFAEFNPLKPILLENHIASQTAEVHMFAEYVKESMPDYVVMSSHGRKGVSRYFMGSFTESFLLQSPVPVFVLGPQYQSPKKLTRALVPVELTDPSKKFISDFLTQNRMEFLETITLFHKITMVDLDDVSWASTLYGIGEYGTTDLLRRAYRSSEQYLDHFLENQKSKRPVGYEISESIDSVAQVLIEKSKENKYDLLVIKSQAGPIASRVLGSVARTVIRDSQLPVLVYPCHYKKNIH